MPGVFLEHQRLGLAQHLEVHAGGHEMELDVGMLELRTRFEERRDMRHREGQQAAPHDGVFERLPDQPRPARQLVHRHVFGLQPPLHADHVVVLEVLADAAQLGHHRDAARGQHLAASDAGQLEKLRRGDGARRQDHLALRPHGAAHAVLQELDADGTLAFEQEARRQRVGLDLQVRPVHDRMEIAYGGRMALAVLHRELEPAHAFLLAGIDVARQRGCRPRRRRRSAPRRSDAAR